MVYELKDAQMASQLFALWDETLITSCLQGVMGKLYGTDPEKPKSVMAQLGDFAFYAGKPSRELILAKPAGFLILVPQNEQWAVLIEACFPGQCKRTARYAIKKDTQFDTGRLLALAQTLPQGYELRRIDGALYDRCLEAEWSKDFVSVFGSKKDYLEKGLGIVALKDGELAAGASSYSRYREGIEIEVDTRQDQRQLGLATACCAKLILECLNQGLYPSWDAQNRISVHLAEKLGYEFSHEYPVYEAYV